MPPTLLYIAFKRVAEWEDTTIINLLTNINQTQYYNRPIQFLAKIT
jgi:hypothetical protein